jgi:DNA-binding NtrC family response regulator
MKTRILVLDDQEQYLRSVARSLQDEYELILASRLDDARIALSSAIGVVLADVRLDENRNDDRQGLDFIRFLRVGYPDMPVIAMSALEAEDIEKDAFIAGATRFLRKPIVISNLKSVLCELVGR